MLRRACLVAIALGGLVGGCAGQPARSTPAPNDTAAVAEARQRIAAAEALCQRLSADPTLTPLRGRLLPTADPAAPWTRAMMIDPGYVDGRDRALLLVMDERRARCRQAMISASPDQAVPMIEYWGRQDNALVELYERRIPIGAYNRAMADAQAQFSIDLKTQRSDNAVRANQNLAPPPQQERRADTPSAYPVDSFRALSGR